MVDVQIEFNKQDMAALKRKLGNLKNKAPLALSRAINRAASNAKTNMGKETKNRYQIKSGIVKDNAHVDKANKGKLAATVTSKGGPIILSENPDIYKISLKRGIKAAVKKGPMKTLDGNPRAFIATMKGPKGGEHTDAYQRYETGHKKAHVRDTRKEGKKRKITKHNVNFHKFYGPAIPSIIKNDETMEIIRKNASETMEKRLEYEIQNILQGGR